MRYQFINDKSDDFLVKKMAKYLNINRSSYYNWQNRKDKRLKRKVREEKIIKEIKRIQEDTRYSYGTPTITKL